MSQIIAVSKEGKNVLTATHPNDFIFHSNYNTLKIIAEGTHQHTLMYNTNYVQTFNTTVAHLQPITPIVLGYVKYKGKVHMIGNRLSGKFGLWWHDTYTYSKGLEVNNTNIKFYYWNQDTNPETAYFKFYIFEVPL